MGFFFFFFFFLGGGGATGASPLPRKTRAWESRGGGGNDERSGSSSSCIGACAISGGSEFRTGLSEGREDKKEEKAANLGKQNVVPRTGTEMVA
mmetsp:Transcript_4284/g.3326  ORF Transcript_4284/g.3326 Transcript_4284/m.3326 type:complete len:94 (-) Transcript_4284:56-337(-)